jgi:signal transduction histidine kinase
VILKETKELSSDVHSLSHQLHSSKLEHVGLVSALRGLCSEVSRKYALLKSELMQGTEVIVEVPLNAAMNEPKTKAQTAGDWMLLLPPLEPGIASPAP